MLTEIWNRKKTQRRGSAYLGNLRLFHVYVTYLLTVSAILFYVIIMAFQCSWEDIWNDSLHWFGKSKRTLGRLFLDGNYKLGHSLFALCILRCLQQSLLFGLIWLAHTLTILHYYYIIIICYYYYYITLLYYHILVDISELRQNYVNLWSVTALQCDCDPTWRMTNN